jgi:hypothetical protein
MCCAVAYIRSPMCAVSSAKADSSPAWARTTSSRSRARSPHVRPGSTGRPVHLCVSATEMTRAEHVHQFPRVVTRATTMRRPGRIRATLNQRLGRSLSPHGANVQESSFISARSNVGYQGQTNWSTQ